jgi:hypothetical protein
MNSKQTYELRKLIDEKYDQLSQEKKDHLYELINDPETRQEIREKIENLIFIRKPPSPEEFLDPNAGYLPPDYIQDLYDYIKEDFIKAMNTKNPYSIISIYGSIRTGKSVLARLFTIYSIIYVSYLRDPHSYYKINKMSKLCIYLVSFKADKTKQVYLSPLLNILDASDLFIREHFEKNVYSKGVDEYGRIHFSEASKFGDITFPKVSIVTGKDAGSLVGADIVAGAISEITFFKEYVPGMTDEQIVRVFTKLYSRIQSTVGFGNFPCWSYIDSSANDADSPIEKMILQSFKNNDKAFYRHYVVWEKRPHLYPEYCETGKTFDICTGDGTIPACIITEENKRDIPKHLVVSVPIDLYKTFEDALIDSIRDLAGKPTGNENRLIQSEKLIENLFNNSYLKNIESSIIADAADMPEELIWRQLIDKFFVLAGENKYIIRRASGEPRYLGWDLSYSLKGDATGLCLLHKEFSRELGQIIYVIDFAFAVLGKEKGINLDAIAFLVDDLKKKGNILVKSLYSDTFQSQPLIQKIERDGVTKVKKHSVDREIEPYQFFLTCLSNGIIKTGKNIFLKNNLKALIRKRTKTGKETIDHLNGNSLNIYYGDWEKSMTGFYAKDVSDATCQALCCARDDAHFPITVYEDENKKYSTTTKDIEKMLNKTFRKIHTYA